MEQNKIIIYADGDCRSNGKENNIGAWGYVATYKGKTIERAKACRNTTNNQQELFEVIQNLQLAYEVMG